MRINNIIIRPILTEKNMALSTESKFVFRVNLKATKGSVASAIEKLYQVNVLDVHTSVMPGKKRRILRKRQFTTTKKWKKAIVKLKEGQKIDFISK